MNDVTINRGKTCGTIILLVAVMLPLALLDFPYNATGSILREFSNLGHVVFFASLSALLVSLSALKRRTLKQQVYLLVASAILLGASIELAQSFTLREPSLMDLFRDLSGTILYLVFLHPLRDRIHSGVRYTLQAMVLCLLIYDSLLPTLRLYDRLQTRHDFPVISNLERGLESLRWDRGKRVTEPVREGRYSLQVKFTTDEYSSVSMNYLHHDWRGFSTLTFSAYNPTQGPVHLSIKIHDRQHRINNLPYGDRYNGRRELTPGWNDITIDMHEITVAPESRLMNLQQIARLQFFTHNLSHATYLYFDNIQLLKE